MFFDITTIYVVSCVMNSLTSLVLGFCILLRDPRSKLHQLWWWMSMAITIWAAGAAVAFASGNNYPVALFSIRLADTIAIFIPLFYLHFIIHFLGRFDQQRILRFFYAASVLLALFGFSPLYIAGVKTKMGIHNFNEAGPLFWLFFTLYVAEPLYAFYMVWQARRASTGTRKMHITYVMGAGVVGFIVGMAWFPICFNIPITPLPGCFVWVYSLLVAWAVFKYQLFDIRVVIRKSLVYSTLITILTAGYFGLVYAVEKLFRTTFGYQSIWMSLCAFSAMTLLFQPLKTWVQRGVDRLIFQVPQEELARRMERLEEEAQQTEKLRAVSTLAAGMAHEIKNPLSAIQTFVDYLPEKHQDPEFVKECHRTLTRESERIYGIVRDVLDFAKPKQPQFKRVDLEALITSTMKLLSNDMVKNQVHWTISCRHGDADCQADSDQLRQVFINLVQNAVHAMPDGGTLTLTTAATNEYVEIKISDTGKGIPKEQIPKIFDPFFTTEKDGNGLGLAVTHSIIRAHRGTIHAESRLGHGTCFTIRLPL